MIEKTIREFVIDALFSIRPNSQFTMGDTYDSLNWISEDQVKPTEAEFDTALASVKAEWTAQEYARNRAAAYDSVGNQLDMLMKDMKNNTTTHQESCEAVKAEFPKP